PLRCYSRQLQTQSRRLRRIFLLFEEDQTLTALGRLKRLIEIQAVGSETLLHLLSRLITIGSITVIFYHLVHCFFRFDQFAPPARRIDQLKLHFFCRERRPSAIG